MESMRGRKDATAFPAPNEERRRTLRPRLAHGLLLAALLSILAGFAGLDRIFYEQVSQRLNTESSPVDRDFYTITRPFWLFCRYAFAHALGGVVIYFLIVGLHSKGFRPANCGLIAVLTAALLANLLQAEIGRLRPNRSNSAHSSVRRHLLAALPHKTSFPSGEAATAFAMAAVLQRVWPRGRYVTYGLALLASTARLVNGAHYLSDVVAGAALGSMIAGSLYRYADRHYEKVKSACQRLYPAACRQAGLPGSPGRAPSRSGSKSGP